MTVLVCPDRLTVDHPDELIRLCGEALAADDDVVLDARALRFADPLGMALLGATCFTVQERGQGVRVTCLQPSVSGYLQRMDVFADVGVIDPLGVLARAVA